MIPSAPHSLTARLFRIGFTVMGTWFQALYDAMNDFAPPSTNPMRNGTE